MILSATIHSARRTRPPGQGRRFDLCLRPRHRRLLRQSSCPTAEAVSSDAPSLGGASVRAVNGRSWRAPLERRPVRPKTSALSELLRLPPCSRWVRPSAYPTWMYESPSPTTTTIGTLIGSPVTCDASADAMISARWRPVRRVSSSTARAACERISLRSPTTSDWVQPTSATISAGGRLDGSIRRRLDVLDRVGSGDAFAAGVVHGLLTGRTLADSQELGIAHGGARDDRRETGRRPTPTRSEISQPAGGPAVVG